MGDPRRIPKKYDTPLKPFDKKAINDERKLLKEYGLRRKRELWRFETLLRRKRKSARELLALPPEELSEKKKILIASLHNLGLLPKNANLDAVLGLSVKDFLERRLVMLVYRKGLAKTVKQARQFVVHGHIAVNGYKETNPNRLISIAEEEKISYYKNKKPKVMEPIRAPEKYKEFVEEKEVPKEEKVVK